MGEYDLSAYLSVFLDEADEQIQILDKEILKLEKDPFNVAVVQSIFRAAHTLKGSSASMGYEKLKQFTHHLENVFEHIRQRELKVTTDLINVLFDSVDVIKKMKVAIEEGQLDSIDISNSIAALEKFLPNNVQLNQQKNEKVFQLEQYQKDILLEGIKNDYYSYEIKVVLNDEADMKNVRAFMVYRAISENGDIIATEPTIETMEQDASFDGRMQFNILSKVEKETLAKVIENISDVSSTKIELLTEQQLTVNTKEQEENEISNLHEQLKVTPTIRVDVEKLDHLMSLVGELVINQTRLVDVRGRFSEKEIRHESEFDVLNEVTNQLSLVISELQDGMMQTRMLPIEQLFNRFPRLIRDTSIKASKEVDFEMVGTETELDRILIEEISDPLIHLLRNAIDHGIENSEERLKRGKPVKGKVILSAAHEEKQVVIRIQDDGGGIDPEKVKAASIEKGIITEAEAKKMTDKEAMFLIFKSGISTAKQVTDISGRGVGMDIVKSHIEKINGVIDIDSTIGVGTTFTIKLPLTLTLSIIRALLIKLSNRTFAIPLVNVLEIIRINKKDIQKVKGQEVGLVRGRILPLVRMKKQLGIEETDTPNLKNREFVVVVGFADKQVGLIVDKTIGNQEIVTKPLGSYIGSPPFISGATIMGDANVALILDIALIVRKFGSEIIDLPHVVQQKEIKQMNQVVTFKVGSEEYGINIQRAKDIVPVSAITRIVEAPPEILGIINLRGKTLPVIDLRKRLDAEETPHTKKSRIIVVEYEQRDIGLLVDEVKQVVKVDSSEKTTDKQEKSNNSQLVRMVQQLNERTVLILDCDEIVSAIEFQNII